MPQFSQPIDFGVTGAVAVTDGWFWSPGAEWAAQDVSGCSVVSLGGTVYGARDLPDPPPGRRATIYLADSFGGHFLFEYGAPPPPPLVVYRSAVVITKNGRLTTADTFGLIEIDVENMPNPMPLGGPDMTAAFYLFDPSAAPADAAILSGRPATVSRITAVDPDSGPWGYTLSYQLEQAHRLPAGSFRGEFGVDYGGGNVKRLPGDESLRITVRTANP